MLPTLEFKMLQWFNVTAPTSSKAEIPNPLLVTDICDPLKSGVGHNHVYFIL